MKKHEKIAKEPQSFFEKQKKTKKNMKKQKKTQKKHKIVKESTLSFFENMFLCGFFIFVFWCFS